MIEKITPNCKNLLLFIVAIFLSSQLFSQTTVIIQDNFNSGFENWSSVINSKVYGVNYTTTASCERSVSVKFIVPNNVINIRSLNVLDLSI